MHVAHHRSPSLCLLRLFLHIHLADAINTVLQLALLQLVPKLIISIVPVKLLPPVHVAEPGIVLETVHEHVRACNGVKHRNIDIAAQRIRVRRQLCALKQDGADVEVPVDDVPGELNDAGLHPTHVDFLALRHGVKAGHVLASNDLEPLVLNIDAALFVDELTHRHQLMPISGEDRDFLHPATTTGDAMLCDCDCARVNNGWW